MALPASDAFARADAATLGGNWDGVTSNQLGIVSNRAAWLSSGAVDKYALWSADSFADDHYSECKAYNTAGAYGYGPCVRMRFITTHTQCQTYWAFIDSSSTVTIYYMNNGSFNACGAQFTGLTVADGDTWRLSVTGATLTLSQNGASIGTRSDSNLATGGAAGLGIYADRGTLDDWAGGNVGGAATFGHECFQQNSQPTNHYRPTVVMRESLRDRARRQWHRHASGLLMPAYA